MSPHATFSATEHAWRLVVETFGRLLGHSDRLVLLVKEGRPLEILEPFDRSKSEVSKETEEVAAVLESSPDVP